MRVSFALIAFLLTALPALAQSDMAPREGWAVHPSDKPYGALIDAVKSTAGLHKLGVVTEAGPTETARARGVEIPGNRVIGLFNNLYAVRILKLSTPAMIEAPIRLYVTENADGTATLSYKLPSAVFAPYAEEAGAELTIAAAELDLIFEALVQDALR
ncbi:MAG: DUF302 domain-containing protein [Mangrovicoccus sp.]|nr:DUF302 domain-containing protein [Mangrovicoccus sp.]